MQTAISTEVVSFHDTQLITFKKDDVIYTAVRPIVEAMGLEWSGQVKKLSNPKFNCVHIYTVAQDGKNRETLCMPIRKLNGWLFSINPEKVREDLKEKVIQYQEECFEVLFDYWNNGVAVNHRLSSDDTLPLRNAVSMATGVLRLDYATIYKMVHQRFGIDEIKELSKEQVEQAVEYVHSLMIKVQKPLDDRLTISAQNLAWHTQFIYSWYKAIEEPFRMLSPKLSGEIHDHIIHAAIFANHIGKHLGYNGMNPERLSNIHWSVGRYY